MKIEDKEFLLKDLSARFPFGVKGKLISNDSPNNMVKLIEILICNEMIECRFSLLEENEEILFNYEGYEYRYYLSEFRPYLFPLSSMTDVQKGIYNILLKGTSIESHVNLLEWLNRHHFDYRGLIEKGLAIDATGLNIYK